MEIDNLCDISASNDVHFIGTGVQSMEINNEVEMSDESCILNENNENLPTKELNESEKAMLQFQKEREDTTFSRTCLFCKQHFIGKRSLILHHLADQHHLFLGQSDNLVYVSEFLDILESMLNKLQCIYCEKLFKDWSALKEHMRKKLHKRINPYNKTFDKFYMTNYLDLFSNSDDAIPNAGEEKEILVGPKEDAVICLFCDKEYADFDEVMTHLEVVHEFNFKKMRRDCGLSFYHQVKLINYIRQKVSARECPVCETTFKTKESLANHMTVSRHVKLIPKRSSWDRPEYFFPTLETDYLLCGLPIDEDGSDNDCDNDDATVKVISEEIQLPKSSVLIDENLRKELL